MNILAIDTSLGAASACVLAEGAREPLAGETLVMERGHAEALLPLVDRVVSRIDGGFDALSRVAVTIGPGSFTGIRIGISAARAFGLACNVPVIGVSTLAALAARLIVADDDRDIVAAIDARHGHVYVQGFTSRGRPLGPPAYMPARAAVESFKPGPLRLVGSGAPALAIEAWSAGIDVENKGQNPLPDIALVARLGLLANPQASPALPLYLKAPDAKPNLPRPNLARPPAKAPEPETAAAPGESP